MNPKKSKEKERRRARKLADEAWEAADAGNLDLAEKIIRRAVDTQPDNPVLRNDQGMLLNLRGNHRGAEEAFRAALSLAPTYAEPCAHLAAIEARDGYMHEAVRWMERAVRNAPDVPDYAERLDAYRALLDGQERTEPAPLAESKASAAPAPAASPLTDRMAALPWETLGEQLTREGCVKVEAILDPPDCATLRAMFDDDTRFAKTVNMDRDDFGKGVYRYFQAPLPAIVDALRREVYVHVARIASNWQELLRETERFPDEWEAFRQQCAAAGQTVPTPILLRYESGGFNALHRDLRGSVFFPIQMAVVLSPVGPDGFTGGEFLFCDVPEGKKARRREIAAGLGDMLLFCTRDRLVPVGGAYGLQPVKHGVKEITAGTRVVLGVPFHEYR
jgi:hypothetical protein